MISLHICQNVTLVTLFFVGMVGKDKMNTIWNEILGPNLDNFDASNSKNEESKENKKSFIQSTFKERDLAFQVYSKPLKCKVWFCSNDAMAKQIMNDDPEAITYTADELTRLLKHNPSPEGLNSINNVKKVLKQSVIIESMRRVEVGDH